MSKTVHIDEPAWLKEICATLGVQRVNVNLLVQSEISHVPDEQTRLLIIDIGRTLKSEFEARGGKGHFMSRGRTMNPATGQTLKASDGEELAWMGEVTESSTYSVCFGAYSLINDLYQKAKRESDEKPTKPTKEDLEALDRIKKTYPRNDKKED